MSGDPYAFVRRKGMERLEVAVGMDKMKKSTSPVQMGDLVRVVGALMSAIQERDKHMTEMRREIDEFKAWRAGR